MVDMFELFKQYLKEALSSTKNPKLAEDFKNWLKDKGYDLDPWHVTEAIAAMDKFRGGNMGILSMTKKECYALFDTTPENGINQHSRSLVDWINPKIEYRDLKGINQIKRYLKRLHKTYVTL